LKQRFLGSFAHHAENNLTLTRDLYGILGDDSHFAEAQKLGTFPTKIKDWKKHKQALKSYLTLSS